MTFNIQGRRVGPNEPVFFIAEAGVNHNGSLAFAFQLVDIAAEAGADAIKFQTFRAEKLNTENAPKSTYHVETTGSDNEQTWFDLLKTQELDREKHEKIIAYCKQRGILFLSTPYDASSADLLNDLGVGAFKVASTDANNLPLIRHIARLGKPVILSSAMCNMEEVIQAVAAVRSEGCFDVVMMHCTGNYPASLDDANLNVIQTYAKNLQCVVGYSDHTPDLISPSVAVALGAKVYEKHFTIDKCLPGPDHRMSLSPEELRATINQIRLAERAMGSPEKVVLSSEKENRLKLRKSIVASLDLKAGTKLREEHIDTKRPGSGLAPNQCNRIIGRRLKVDIKVDTLLDESMFED